MLCCRDRCYFCATSLKLYIFSKTEKGTWVGKDDDIKAKCTAYGRCLMEKATAMLIVGQWPTFQTEEGKSLAGFEEHMYRNAMFKMILVQVIASSTSKTRMILIEVLRLAIRVYKL